MGRQVVSRALLITLLTFLTWFSIFPLYAQVKGLIIGPGSERFPIAVSPLKDTGQGVDDRRLSEGMADIVARDLDLSGWFRVLDRSAYIENPQRSGINLGSFDFRDWSTIGAEALVKGGFKVKGEELVTEFRLFDVYQRKQIVGKRYSGKLKDFRRIAHKFADEIVFQFTGVRGVFDTRIAYVSTAGGRFKEIYVAHLDGTEKLQVTNNRTINLFPSWTPDGRAILYTSYKKGKPSVYRFDIFSGEETEFSSRRGLNLGGRWSPDGKYVALTLERRGNVDIYLLDDAGKILRRLTKDPGIDVSPAWSPGGKQLTFVSNRSGSPQLYVMGLSDSGARRLTYTGEYNTSPSWSPKGDLIAYTGLFGARFNIFIISSRGGDPQMLTSNSGDNEDPSWSPDGRYIVFSSNRGGRYHLYVMRANGENQRQLTRSQGDDTNPSWSPRLD
ncbi:MAG: Tol-Pal system beta propeller repeat protein TolB [Candidatus Binatia bacterium]